MQPATHKQYNHHWSMFCDFVRQLGHEPTLPANHDLIAMFVAHLHGRGLKYTTIRAYLSAISKFHKPRNLPDHTQSHLVTQALLGIKNLKQDTGEKLLPITKVILHKLVDNIRFLTSCDFTRCLVKALFLTMFHLCLRVSEVAVCSDNKHSLDIQQVKELDGGFEIQFISYKHSADSKPKVLLQPQKQTNYCPVVALREYIKVRGQSIGPLFKDAQNKPVTRHCLLKHLRSSLELAGFDPKLFNTHSFRSGRATQLAADNVNDKTIKETGRWKSSAYLQYIRPSHFTLPN